MSKFFHIVIGLLFTVFGIYLWNNPAETIIAYSLYLGLVHLAGSIATLVFCLVQKIKPIPIGNILVSFIIGFVILSLPFISLTVILWIFIFTFLTATVFFLVTVLRNKDGNKWHILQLILAILGVCFAVVMLFRPVTAVATLAKILAAVVIINGVSYLFSGNRR